MNQALNLITSLVNKAQTLQQVADQLVHGYAPFAYQLSKIIDKEFHDTVSDKKCVCISLVCEILRKSFENNCSHQFVKGLAQRLRYFLHEMSRNYVSEGMALQINRNVDSLKYKGVFCDEYFEKLQLLARKIKQNSDPQNGKALQRSISFEENPKNYSRTFLSMVRDINKCESLKPILQTYNEFVQIDRDNTNQRKLALNKSGSIDLQASIRQSDDGNNNKASTYIFNHKYIDTSISSIQLAQTKKQRLQKVIIQCHLHILALKRSMGEQVKRYQQGFNNVLGRVESQCNFLLVNTCR